MKHHSNIAPAIAAGHPANIYWLMAMAMLAMPAAARDLTIGATGRVSIELVGSDAVFSNTLLLVSVSGSTGKPVAIKSSGCKLEAPFDGSTTNPLPALQPLLSEKKAQKGCRVTLDSDGTTPEIEGFNTGTTFEFKVCAQTDADSDCEGVWSSNPQLNSDSFDHVITTDLHPVDYAGRVYQLGWEDTADGGDKDFNDLIAVVRVELDSDGDGLWDDWESHGIDTDGNGTVDLKLPDADPRRKDIYLQIDYMGCSDSSRDCSTGHTHKPNDTAIADVVAAFAKAPVSNPNGEDGIRLHIEVENEIPHEAEMELEELDKIKTHYFKNEKRFAYRYCIYAHSRKGTSSSGVAEIFGNDLIVSLGNWDNNVGSREQQAGTLMHEFGHTLGLRHGGGDDMNNKPNYLSVMNYAYQTVWLPMRREYFRGIVAESSTPVRTDSTTRIDFSRWQLPELDEEKLQEKDGLLSNDANATFPNYPRFVTINDALDPVEVTRHIYRTKHLCPSQTDPIVSDIPVAGMDWDCNGAADGVDVKVNINYDYEPKQVCNGTGANKECHTEDDRTKPIYTKLTGFDDWANIKYNFQTSDQFRDGVRVEVSVEPTREQVQVAADQTNHVPVAMIKPVEDPTIRWDMQLDGSASVDPDGQALTYSWRVIQGSAALLNGTTATPRVQFSGYGDYIFALTVTDAKGASNTQTVTVRYRGR